MRVYKFLPKKWGIESLRTRRLKIARLDELNDPFELYPFDTSALHIRWILGATLRRLSQDRGFICFSRGWSNPVIWAHYADQHRGMCLGFDIPDDFGQAVEYVDARRPLPDLGDPALAANLEVANRLLFTKYSDWRYENEVRTALALDPTTVDRGLYFKRFDESLELAEVVLGIRCQACPRELREALDGSGLAPKLIRAIAEDHTFGLKADPLIPRDHDELVYYVKRGAAFHPVE